MYNVAVRNGGLKPDVKSAMATLLERMPRRRVFRFEARAQGRPHSGFIRADNREMALAALASRHWVPLSLEEVRPAPRPFAAGRPREAARFFSQMAVLYRNGVQLDAGLKVLGLQSQGRFRRAVLSTRIALRSGQSLSQAMGNCPALFPTWTVTAVAAAEGSGTMAETLDRLAATLERRQALWHRLRQALTYPLWVLALGLVLNLALARSLLPAFSQAFSEAGIPLPAFSRLVLEVTRTAGDPRTWTVVVALLGLAWLGSRQRDPGALLDRLPLVGTLRRGAGRVEALYTLAALLESGIPMQKALTGTVRAASTPALRADLEAVRGRVLDGLPLSQALAAQGFSLMAVQFARAAEESGNYPRLLRQVAETHADSQELTLQATTRLLEPILVALLGLVIGTVSVALFIPLYSAAAAW